jgi:hypothetical protein
MYKQAKGGKKSEEKNIQEEKRRQKWLWKII